MHLCTDLHPFATYCCTTYCMCVWEWIAATVQAMRFHLEMKLNRGGTVAAISLSTMHMRSAACPAVMLIIVQHLEFDIFEMVSDKAFLTLPRSPTPPHPNILLNPIMFQ